MPVGVPPGSYLDGSGYDLSLQRFAPHQTACAHPRRFGRCVTALGGGNGEARLGTAATLLARPGMVIGRAERHAHGFLSGPEPMYLLSRVPNSWARSSPVSLVIGGIRFCPPTF